MDICSTKKQEKENEHESMFTGRGRKADGKLFFCADRRHRNPHLVSDRFDHQDPEMCIRDNISEVRTDR